jgi:hypothetical protein
MASEMPPPVAAVLDAANSGNIEQFLDCFASDGSVDDWGRIFSGRQAIRDWSDREFIGAQVSLEVMKQSADGETAVVTTQVGGSGFNGEGTFTFTTEGAVIRQMRITA